RGWLSRTTATTWFPVRSCPSSSATATASTSSPTSGCSMPSCRLETPIGTLALAATDSGLGGVWFDGARIEPSGSCSVLDEACRQLDAYFAGELIDFDLPLDL